MRFVYDEDFGTLDAEDFENDLISAIADFTSNMHWPSYFPSLSMGIYRIIWILPAWVLERSLKVAVRPRKCLEVSCQFFMTYGRAIESWTLSIRAACGYSNSSLRRRNDTAAPFHVILTMLSKGVLRPNQLPLLPQPQHRPASKRLRYYPQPQPRKGPVHPSHKLPRGRRFRILHGGDRQLCQRSRHSLVQSFSWPTPNTRATEGRAARSYT